MYPPVRNSTPFPLPVPRRLKTSTVWIIMFWCVISRWTLTLPSPVRNDLLIPLDGWRNSSPSFPANVPKFPNWLPIKFGAKAKRVWMVHPNFCLQLGYNLKYFFALLHLLDKLKLLHDHALHVPQDLFFVLSFFLLGSHSSCRSTRSQLCRSGTGGGPALFRDGLCKVCFC